MKILLMPGISSGFWLCNKRIISILLAYLFILPFSVSVHAVSHAYEAQPNQAIVDNGCLTTTLNVPDTFYVGDINVGINLSHTYRADLDVYLTSPTGTTKTLFTAVGGSYDNFDILLDDNVSANINSISGSTQSVAAPYYQSIYTSESGDSLTSFIGFSAKGNWTLEVCDTYSADSGTLYRWRLDFLEGNGEAPPAYNRGSRDFVERATAEYRGNFEYKGNTLLQCTSGCSPTIHNNSPMSYVDIDGDTSTFNSSSATVSLPAGAEVTWAGLYWGGVAGSDSSAWSGITSAPNINEQHKVKFKTPGNTYHDVEAIVMDTINDDPISGWRTYQAVADVTEQVKAAGSGQYTVANVQLDRGGGSSSSAFTGPNGGWTLVVFYKSDTEQYRHMTVWDGFDFIYFSDSNHLFTVDSIRTPPSGSFETEIAVTCFDGEVSTGTGAGDGDFLALGSTSNKLTNALNPSTNVCNGTISDAGVNMTSRNPALTQNWAFDIDRFSFSNTSVIPNNASSVTAIFGSDNEGIWFGNLVLSTELFIPPQIEKSFAVTETPAGAAFDMTLNLSNSNLSGSLASIAFSDTYPTGLSNAASGAVKSNTCGGSLVAIANAGSLQFSGGNLNAGQSCSMVISVIADSSAIDTTLENCTSTVSSSSTESVGEAACATVDILDPNSANLDFGDAPASYGDASHTITTGLHLGATPPDAEDDSQHSHNAYGDGDVQNDANGTWYLSGDEDGAPSQPITQHGTYIPLFPVLKMTAMDYSADFTVTNTTGNGAKLFGWIDFDGNGSFDPNEGTWTHVAHDSNASAVTLNWNVPVDIELGTTFIRLRLTTDNSISVSKPDGLASDGEVEDFALAVAIDIPPDSDDVAVVKGETPLSCQVVIFQDDFDDVALNSLEFISPERGVGGGSIVGLRDWTIAGGGNDTYARMYDVSDHGMGTAVYLGNGAVRRVSPAFPDGFSFDEDGRLTDVIDAIEIKDNADDLTPGVTLVGYTGTSDWGPDPVSMSRDFATEAGKVYRMYFKAIPEGGPFSKGVMRVDVPGGSLHFKTPGEDEGVVDYAIEFTAISTKSRVSFVNYGHINRDLNGWCDPVSQYNAQPFCTVGGSHTSNGNELIIDQIALVENDCGPGSITGTVYIDSNENNQFDAATEAVIPNITINLYDDKGTPTDTSDDALLYIRTTDASGAYTIDGLDAKQSYRITVYEADNDLPNNITLGTANPLTGVTVPSGGIQADQDFGFDAIPVGDISGTVYLDTNNNKVFDAGTEFGLSSVAVTLLDDADDSVLETVNSTVDGSFVFKELNSMLSYRLEVDTTDPDVPTELTLGTSNPLSGITVVADSETTGQDFGFALSGSGVDGACPAGMAAVSRFGNASSVALDVGVAFETEALGLPATVGTVTGSGNSALLSRDDKLVLDFGEIVAGGSELEISLGRNYLAGRLGIEVSLDNSTYTSVGTYGFAGDLGPGTVDRLGREKITVPGDGARYIRFVRESGGIWVDAISYDTVCDSLASYGSITGFVYVDSDADDTFEPTLERGIGAISLSLYDDKGTPADVADDTFIASTDSLANGFYSFANLETELQYRVEVDVSDSELPAKAAIGTPNPLTGLAVAAGAVLGSQDFGFDVSYSNNYCVTTTDPTGLLELGDLSTEAVNGSGQYSYDNRVVPGYGTVDVTVDMSGGQHKASGSAIETGERQSIWLDEELPESGSAIYLEPNRNGTAQVTYRFDQPAGNVDLLLLDLDFEDTVQVSAKDGDGQVVSDFTGWRYRSGDMSVWQNPNPEDALPPVWDSLSATLTSTDDGNDHRSFGLLTPDTLVTEITVTFTVPNASGRHIYTTLHTTPLGRDGDSCATGGISGFVYTDVDRNGTFNPASDSGIAGVTVGLFNDDSELVATATTHADGSYAFAELDAQFVYRLFVDSQNDVIPQGYLLNTVNPLENVAVIDDQVTAGQNFGFVPPDRSDAPVTGTVPNGVHLASYGEAIHMLTNSNRLGVVVDGDVVSLSDSDATGDDKSNIDDEDGVVFGVMDPGNKARLAITVQQDVPSAAYLQGWIDWNSDGDFLDQGEQIASDLQLASGTSGVIELNLFVPEDAVEGYTFARFRWSSTAGLDSVVLAGDGEVEDYLLKVYSDNDGDGVNNNDDIDDDNDGIIDILEGSRCVPDFSNAEAGKIDQQYWVAVPHSENRGQHPPLSRYWDDVDAYGLPSLEIAPTLTGRVSAPAGRLRDRRTGVEAIKSEALIQFPPELDGQNVLFRAHANKAQAAIWTISRSADPMRYIDPFVVWQSSEHGGKYPQYNGQTFNLIDMENGGPRGGNAYPSFGPAQIIDEVFYPELETYYITDFKVNSNQFYYFASYVSDGNYWYSIPVAQYSADDGRTWKNIPAANYLAGVTFDCVQASDADGDGITDDLDIDSDNDGIPDNVEAQRTIGYISPSGLDIDENGLDDSYESSPGAGEGIVPVDTDNDGIADFLDFDSDDDDLFDIVESGSGLPDGDDDGMTDGLVGRNGLDNTIDTADDYSDTNGIINSPEHDLADIDGDVSGDIPLQQDVDYRDQGSKVSGQIFEDIKYGGGPGRNVAGSRVGVNGVLLELYDDTGTLVATTTTANDGDQDGMYSFDSVNSRPHYLRVVNDSVRSTRIGSNGSELAVQTYRSNGSTAVTNEIGGRYPAEADAGANLSEARLNVNTFRFTSVGMVGLPTQSIQPLQVDGEDFEGVDFGFNFNTIVNTNSDGQGSLRQFVHNTNLLEMGNTVQQLPSSLAGDYGAGDTVAIFMIPVSQLNQDDQAEISLQQALLINESRTVIDGRLQAANMGEGTIVLKGHNSGSGQGISYSVQANRSVLRAVTIQDFSQSGVLINGTGSDGESGVTIVDADIHDNGHYGVLIQDGAARNQLIGNRIAGNNWAGIVNEGDSHNTFSRNSITDNGGLGIDLGADGVTENSNTDTWLNYPEITAEAGASISTNGTMIVTYDFDLDVPANTHGYRVEFFMNGTVDGSGHGEGESYLGYVELNHSGGGAKNFKGTFNANQVVPENANIAVTVTEILVNDILGATSEFSGVRNGNVSVCTDLLSDPDADLATVTIDEGNNNIAFLEAKDANGNPVTYIISGGPDGSRFVIKPTPPDALFDCVTVEFISGGGTIGTRTLPAGSIASTRTTNYEAPTDFGGDNSYDLMITAIDSQGNRVTKPMTITVRDVNERPVITTAPNLNFTERQSGVVQDVDAWDPDEGDAEGNGLVYSLSGGADMFLFHIEALTGKLRFTQVPDYQHPQDSDGDNVYEVKVRVTDDQGYAASKLLSITVLDDPNKNSVILSAKALLQGAWEDSTGLMHDTLRSEGVLPVNQPYGREPFNHVRTESINLDLVSITDHDAMVDWVLLELWNAQQPDQRVASYAFLLQRDGDLMDAQSGSTQLQLENMSTGSYYVSLQHRNHLRIRTAEPVALGGGDDVLIDFSQPDLIMQGSHTRQLTTVEADTGVNATGAALEVALLWSGDITNDQRLVLSGQGNDLNPILTEVLTATDNSLFNSSYQVAGYRDTDLNMDGVTLFMGPGNDANVLLGNILVHPANDGFQANFVVEGVE